MADGIGIYQYGLLQWIGVDRTGFIGKLQDTTPVGGGKRHTGWPGEWTDRVGSYLDFFTLGRNGQIAKPTQSSEVSNGITFKVLAIRRQLQPEYTAELQTGYQE